MAHGWKNANEILLPKYVSHFAEKNYNLKKYLFLGFWGFFWGCL